MLVLVDLLRLEHKKETSVACAHRPPLLLDAPRSLGLTTPRDGRIGADSRAKREIVAWMWYSSSFFNFRSARGVSAREPVCAPLLEQGSGALMSQYLTRNLAQVRTHSTADPDVSPELRAYPVVILRATAARALTTDFTTLAEDLASHGYFVVGFDAPYRTFVVVLQDGRVVRRPPANDPENLPADQSGEQSDQQVFADVDQLIRNLS